MGSRKTSELTTGLGAAAAGAGRRVGGSKRPPPWPWWQCGWAEHLTGPPITLPRPGPAPQGAFESSALPGPAPSTSHPPWPRLAVGCHRLQSEPYNKPCFVCFWCLRASAPSSRPALFMLKQGLPKWLCCPGCAQPWNPPASASHPKPNSAYLDCLFLETGSYYAVRAGFQLMEPRLASNLQ